MCPKPDKNIDPNGDANAGNAADAGDDDDPLEKPKPGKMPIKIKDPFEPGSKSTK